MRFEFYLLNKRNLRGEIVNFKDIQSLRKRHTKDEFEEILLAIDKDLKFNHLRFKKSISKEKFLEVLNTTENLFRRLYEKD